MRKPLVRHETIIYQHTQYHASIFGYLEGTAPDMQPASAINAIKFEVGYLGAIIAAVCLVLIILMNIDKYIKQIQIDLEAKHAAKN